MCITATVISDDSIIPIIGARKINAAILRMTMLCTDAKPLAAMAAPANPPMSVCEEEEGMPNHHVAKFHAMAAISPERMIGRVMNCS
jgi:hypothetical protein